MRLTLRWRPNPKRMRMKMISIVMTPTTLPLIIPKSNRKAEVQKKSFVITTKTISNRLILMRKMRRRFIAVT
jgi:hypothetical protein